MSCRLIPLQVGMKILDLPGIQIVESRLVHECVVFRTAKSVQKSKPFRAKYFGFQIRTKSSDFGCLLKRPKLAIFSSKTLGFQMASKIQTLRMTGPFVYNFHPAPCLLYQL